MESAALEEIEKMIFVIRDQKVMLDSDLARLYEVEVGALNRAVRRNKDRFPADFCFQLTAEEYRALRCQLGILRTNHGKHRKYWPFAFTEQGVAMLSGVLHSSRAVRVNIGIMRTFVRLRQLLIQESLLDRVAKLEKGTDRLFRVVFQRLDSLERSTPILPEKRRKMGLSQD